MWRAHIHSTQDIGWFLVTTTQVEFEPMTIWGPSMAVLYQASLVPALLHGRLSRFLVLYPFKIRTGL